MVPRDTLHPLYFYHMLSFLHTMSKLLQLHMFVFFFGVSLFSWENKLLFNWNELNCVFLWLIDKSILTDARPPRNLCKSTLNGCLFYCMGMPEPTLEKFPIAWHLSYFLKLLLLFLPKSVTLMSISTFVNSVFRCSLVFMHLPSSDYTSKSLTHKIGSPETQALKSVCLSKRKVWSF